MSTLNLPQEITNDLDSKGLLIGSKMKNLTPSRYCIKVTDM